MLNFLEHAEKLIRISSISENGNEEIANYLQNLMQRCGFKTTLQEVTHSLDGVSKHQYNVIGIMGDPLVDRSTKKGLMLNTHIDTVSPGIKSYWTETNQDPFQLTINEGKLYGLGTADVKLDFLCKLKACEKYKDRRLRMPIYLVGTAGEEIGMIGAKFLIRSRIVNPKYIIVGEPSDLAVISAHKAYAVYKISIDYNQRERDAKGFNTRVELQCMGKSAHGSYPHLGDNAIHKVLGVLRKIYQANFQIKLGRISGGELVNKVPDRAKVDFYLSSSSFDDFRKLFREKLIGPDIQVEFGGLGESGMKFMPDNVVDAIEGLLSAIAKLEADFLAPKDESYNPPTSTTNLGRLMHRPDGVDMLFDVRLLPSISPEAFDEKLKGVVQSVRGQFSNLIMRVERKRINPSLDMKNESELVTAALEAQKAAGITPRLDKKATSTEAAQYFQAGYDAFVFGPGKSMGNSHSPNEHNLIDHLDRAVHFYDRMIEKFCI